MSYDLGKAVGFKFNDQPVCFDVAALKDDLVLPRDVGFVDPQGHHHVRSRSRSET